MRAATRTVGRKDKERMGVDPQNTFWANDTNKFGRKMLERMGWAEGKGLGADGQGTTTHVEVVRKLDNAGAGHLRLQFNSPLSDH